jgi:poly(3-hydroxybutyrate) depolymerase
MGSASSALAGLILAASALHAADLPRGQVIERVDVIGNERHSYALYLPSNYTPERKWPLLVCLDPGARGKVPVERFAAAAEKYGFVVVGSNNSRNGPMAVSAEAIMVLTEELPRRYSIDDQRRFACGLSGGSRVALSWAQAANLNGVVANAAAFGPGGIPKQRPFSIYAVAGRDDFNYHELYSMALELGHRGWPVRFAEFEGGHEWLPAAQADEALQFLSGQIGPQTPPDSKDERKMAERFARMTAELAGADEGSQKSMIGSWKKQAGKPDGRVARQALAWAFIRSVEEGRQLLAGRKFLEAAAMADIAVLVRPEAPNAWMAVAEAQAGLGDKKKARLALDKAAELGFRDQERITALRERLGR